MKISSAGTTAEARAAVAGHFVVAVGGGGAATVSGLPWPRPPTTEDWPLWISGQLTATPGQD